jgi:hypothetical protein
MDIWDDVRNTKITVKDNQENEAERLTRGPGPQYLIEVHIIRLGDCPVSPDQPELVLFS